MPTKTIILGKPEPEAPPKNTIEFVQLLNVKGEFQGRGQCPPPGAFNFIELIAKDYFGTSYNNYDLMFAYNNPNERQTGMLFIGYWNDGIVSNV